MSNNKKVPLSYRKVPEQNLDRWVAGQIDAREVSRAPDAAEDAEAPPPPLAPAALETPSVAVAAAPVAAPVAVTSAGEGAEKVSRPEPKAMLPSPSPSPAALVLAPAAAPAPEPAAVVAEALASKAEPAKRGKGGRRSGGGRVLVKRADGKEVTRLQVYLEPALAKKLKRHCVDIETDMTSFVRTLIEQALKRV